MNNGQLTGAVYVDLSKAFNAISHRFMKDKELEWFNSYAFNGKNYVCVDRYTSSPETVYCVVPQGLILGPLLFIIFINDLSDCIEHVSVIMYADDTVLYVSHKSKEKIENDLNQDLQNFYPTFLKMSLL